MIFSKHSGYSRCGRRVLPFGGDKQQNTTATTTTVDARQVNTTDINDLSAHDSNNTSFWADSSTSNSNNTSANFTTIDSGTKITNTTTNTLDGGAISGMASVALAAGSNALDQIKSAMGLATSVVTGSNDATAHAYEYADGLFHASLEAVQASDTRAYDAWDRASKMETGALSTLQNAYADAKGTTQANQQMVFALAGVAGLAILMMRKG